MTPTDRLPTPEQRVFLAKVMVALKGHWTQAAVEMLNGPVRETKR